MLTVYVVPEDLIAEDWTPTQRSVALLGLNSAVSEMFYFGDTFGDEEEHEERELWELLTSPLAYIIPSVEGRALPAPAATRIENNRLSETLSDLCDGPWKIYFNEALGIFENLHAAIEQALEEGAGLLIIRT